MSVLKATLELYWRTVREASIRSWRGWPLFIGSVVIYLVFRILLRGVHSLPGAQGGFTPAGFLLGMVSILFLAVYYDWLGVIYEEKKLSWKRLVKPQLRFFWGILGVAFVLMIVDIISQSVGPGAFVLALNVLVFVIFNAVVEVVYISNLDSVHALSEAALFVRDNWIEWFAPLVLLLLPVIALFSGLTLLFFGQADPLLPPMLLVSALETYFAARFPQFGMLGALVPILIANWFMVFRALLFDELRSGTRRQRAFRSRTS